MILPLNHFKSITTPVVKLRIGHGIGSDRGKRFVDGARPEYLWDFHHYSCGGGGGTLFRLSSAARAVAVAGWLADVNPVVPEACHSCDKQNRDDDGSSYTPGTDSS